MRLHTQFFLSGLLLILLVVGCTQSNQSIETLQPESIVTPTRTITAMLAFTPTAVPTNTPTSIPTFPVEHARARLLELLANNGDCRLPCLWGITPGKSTSQEAQAILSPFSGISISTNFDPDGGSIAPWYTEGDLILSTTVGFNLGFLSDKQIVSYLTFKAGETKKLPDGFLPIYDSKTFGERLHPYMLPGILSALGEPASVIIHTLGREITGSGGFEILLLYPDQGIFARYTMQMETVGTNARGCPANAQVELYLYPSGDADAFAKSLSELSLGGIFDGLELVDNPSWKSIDKATSMSLEQFYETFRQPTDKCIETPLKGWYVPQ